MPNGHHGAVPFDGIGTAVFATTQTITTIVDDPDPTKPDIVLLNRPGTITFVGLIDGVGAVRSRAVAIRHPSSGVVEAASFSSGARFDDVTVDGIRGGLELHFIGTSRGPGTPTLASFTAVGASGRLEGIELHGSLVATVTTAGATLAYQAFGVRHP